MNELELSRKEISRIDAEMAKLFEERMHQCENVAAYKKEHGLSVDTEATTVEEARASLMQALTGIDSGRSDIHR